MITLTEQELIDVFEYGIRQGNNEAVAHEWGERSDRSAKQALLDALQELIYERRRVEFVGKDTWPTGAQWPEETEVRAEFDLKTI